MAAKLMTITIKVEPPALGPVLLKLKEMPGIAEFHFDVSDSKATGDGAPALGRPTIRPDEVATALLIKGPVNTAQMMRGLIAAGHKGSKSQASNVMHVLRKKGIAKTIDKGVIELTAKARKSITGHEDSALRLLPKPKAKAANGHRKTTRVGPGVAPRAILEAVASGPAKRPEIRTRLAEHGLSEKSVEGVIARGRMAGFLKLDDGVVSLTAKGKHELEKLTAETTNG